jgi:histidinol-phosphate aminotransferase
VLGYGGRLEFVPYRDDCHNDLEALVDRACATGAKLLYLANPDNPTGTFHGRAAIEDLIANMPEGCLLLLDEAYAEFALAGELPPLDAEDPRVIRLRTFSKAHGMAGLRVGYGFTTSENIDAFNRIRLHFGVGRLAQVAALASLGDPGFAADVVRRVEEGRAEYAALGRELDIPTQASLTNFVPFDFGTGEASDRMLVLLDERDVFVRKPGAAPLDRFVRVTVGTKAERGGFAEAFRDAVKVLRG